MQVSGKDTTKRVDCEPERPCLNAEKRLCFVQFAVAAWARVCVGTPQGRTGADQRGRPYPQGLKIPVCATPDQVPSSTRDFFPTRKTGLDAVAATVNCARFGQESTRRQTVFFPVWFGFYLKNRVLLDASGHTTPPLG